MRFNISFSLILDILDFLGKYSFDENSPPSSMDNVGYNLKKKLQKELTEPAIEINNVEVER
jgi:hypothetical protein